VSDERISSASKPQLLRAALLAALQDGSYKVGDRFPSEPELIARYGISRATVREAIIGLEQDGWLRRLQGKGTFVSERPKLHRTIAVIAPYLYATESAEHRAGTDVMPILMQSIEHHARKHGLSISLYLDNMEVETERENLGAVFERAVDAVLVNYIGCESNLDCLARIVESEIPLVLFDRYVDELALDSVSSDNRTGSYRATLRFLDGGFPTVEFVTGVMDNTALRDRHDGYVVAMNERGLAPRVHVLKHEIGEGTDRINYDRTRDLVHSFDFPTAIFCADATRLAVVSQIVERLSVPYPNYALGCFDEPYLNLPEELLLVRVLQPLREIGRNAIDLTVRRLNGDAAPPAQVQLAPEILVTGAPTQSVAGS